MIKWTFQTQTSIKKNKMKELKTALLCLLWAAAAACGDRSPQPADQPIMTPQNNTKTQIGSFITTPSEETTQPPDETAFQNTETRRGIAEAGVMTEKSSDDRALDANTSENVEEIRSVQILNYLNNSPGNGTHIGKGVGVFICPDILVTAFHVVDEFIGPVRDRLFFEDPYTYNNRPLTTIVGLSEKYDLAALRAEGYEPENC